MDKNSYHSVLEDVYKNYSKYEEKASKLKKWVRKEFEAKKQYDAFANAVLPESEQKQEENEFVVSFD